MNYKVVTVFSVGVGLLLASGLSFAHHSEAALDKEHSTTITGTVTKWVFANPHPTVFLDGDVKDRQGNVVNWYAAGGGGVLGLREAGWTNKTLAPGDRVLIQGQQVKDGRPVMGMRKLYRCSGEQVQMGYDPTDPKTIRWEPLSPERVREMCAAGVVEGLVKPELFSSAN